MKHLDYYLIYFVIVQCWVRVNFFSNCLDMNDAVLRPCKGGKTCCVAEGILQFDHILIIDFNTMNQLTDSDKISLLFSTVDTLRTNILLPEYFSRAAEE